MNWFILLLLVPGILGLIVLHCGFAGCGSFDAAPANTPESPTGLKATATGTGKVKLEWQDNSGGSAKFTAQRDGKDIPSPSDPSVPLNVTSPFEDSGLNDGTDFVYTVKAVVAMQQSDASNIAKATTQPNVPTNLVATPVASDRIKLSWNLVTNSKKTIRFRITDTLKTTPGGVTNSTVSATKLDPTTFTLDLTVAPGSMHEFQVTAVVSRFDDSPASPQTVESAPSEPPVPGAPVIINPNAFQAGPGTSANQPGIQGATIVQLLSKSVLKSGGSTVKITLRGADPTVPDAGPLIVDRVYISQVDLTPGRDPYDSRASGPSGLTRVFDSSPPFNDPKVTLSPGDTKPLTVVPYTLVPTQDLLIAFDINPAVGQGTLRFAPQAGAVSYARLAPPGMTVQESAVADRAPGYAPANNNLYLIEKIEVA